MRTLCWIKGYYIGMVRLWAGHKGAVAYANMRVTCFFDL